MDVGRIIELCALAATATGTVGVWIVAWRAKQDVAQFKIQIGNVNQQIVGVTHLALSMMGGGGGGGGGQHGGAGGGGGGGLGAPGGDGGSVNFGPQIGEPPHG
jgi:hypothetical protein